MIEGLLVRIGPEAVVVVAAQPLRVLSSAVLNGGLVSARAVVNLHVGKDDPCADPPAMLAAYARRAGVPKPFVGLLTGAWTEHAARGEEDGAGIRTLAVATVGLSNGIAAGRTPVTGWTHGTINTVVVVDADPEPSALVNAVITVTEVKTLLLHEAGVRDAAGALVTGTSTDAVVIAATGRGARARFGGPASELGWSMAQAARRALDAGIRGWRERNP
jgi:adenosylcobinamide kinase/adenosylcobinamide-phosphate guanylyltransferase